MINQPPIVSMIGGPFHATNQPWESLVNHMPVITPRGTGIYFKLGDVAVWT